MYLYRAYGLAIASENALPELVPADFTTADVTIRQGRIGRLLSETTPVVFDVGAREAYLAWSEVGAFLVENGETILADLRPGISDELARLPLLGAVLAVLLHQRGLLVLHASAVTIAGRAAIFVGSKGAGKSNMAAALFARRHRLVADDIVAADCSGDGGPRLVPGFPQLKLYPAAATILLGEQGEALPPIHRWTEKRCRSVDEGRFADRPVPPGRIYLLAGGEACREAPLAPQRALTTLLQHSYMARFGDQLLRGVAAGKHLRQCAHLAGCARVHRLEVPVGTLQGFGQAARLVEASFAEASPAATSSARRIQGGSTVLAPPGGGSIVFGGGHRG